MATQTLDHEAAQINANTLIEQMIADHIAECDQKEEEEQRNQEARRQEIRRLTLEAVIAYFGAAWPALEPYAALDFGQQANGATDAPGFMNQGNQYCRIDAAPLLLLPIKIRTINTGGYHTPQIKIDRISILSINNRQEYRRPEDIADALAIARVGYQEEHRQNAEAAAAAEAEAAHWSAQRAKKEAAEAQRRAKLDAFAVQFAAHMEAVAEAHAHNCQMIAAAQKLHDLPFILQEIEIAKFVNVDDGDPAVETEIRTIAIEINGYDPDPAPGYRLEVLPNGATRSIRFRHIVADRYPTRTTPTQSNEYARRHRIDAGIAYYVKSAPGIEIDTAAIARTLIPVPDPPAVELGSAEQDHAAQMIARWEKEHRTTYPGPRYGYCRESYDW